MVVQSDDMYILAIKNEKYSEKIKNICYSSLWKVSNSKIWAFVLELS